MARLECIKVGLASSSEGRKFSDAAFTLAMVSLPGTSSDDLSLQAFAATRRTYSEEDYSEDVKVYSLHEAGCQGSRLGLLCLCKASQYDCANSRNNSTEVEKTYHAERPSSRRPSGPRGRDDADDERRFCECLNSYVNKNFSYEN